MLRSPNCSGLLFNTHCITILRCFHLNLLELLLLEKLFLNKLSCQNFALKYMFGVNLIGIGIEVISLNARAGYKQTDFFFQKSLFWVQVFSKLIYLPKIKPDFLLSLIRVFSLHYSLMWISKIGTRMVTYDWSSLGISNHHECNPTYSKTYFMTSTFASIFINIKYFLKKAYIHSLK